MTAPLPTLKSWTVRHSYPLTAILLAFAVRSQGETWFVSGVLGLMVPVVATLVYAAVYEVVRWLGFPLPESNFKAEGEGLAHLVVGVLLFCGCWLWLRSRAHDTVQAIASCVESYDPGEPVSRRQAVLGCYRELGEKGDTSPGE